MYSMIKLVQINSTDNDQLNNFVKLVQDASRKSLHFLHF